MKIKPLPGQLAFIDHPIPEQQPRKKRPPMNDQEFMAQSRLGAGIDRLEEDIRRLDAEMKDAKRTAKS